MEQRFGINDGRRRSYREVGEELGVTAEAARRLRLADAAYFDEFWTEPGYLGHEAPASVGRDIVQHRCEGDATITTQEARDLGLDVGPQPGQADGGVIEDFRLAETAFVRCLLR